jgi:hypothetical protein
MAEAKTEPPNIIQGDEPWVVAYSKWMLDLYAAEPEDGPWHRKTKNDLLTAFNEGFKAGEASRG